MNISIYNAEKKIPAFCKTGMANLTASVDMGQSHATKTNIFL